MRLKEEEQISEAIEDLERILESLDDLQGGQRYGFRGTMAAVREAILDIRRSVAMLKEALEYTPRR